MASYAILAVGVFLGNWLICPLFLKGRSFTDGFFIGLIAAILTLLFGGILSCLS